MDQIDKDTAELADTTIVPDDAQANSQQLLTIFEMRGEILERVESDNMDQIDKDTAELADTTIVPDDAQANSQKLLTIFEMRRDIFERVESYNMDQVDPADVTSV